MTSRQFKAYHFNCNHPYSGVSAFIGKNVEGGWEQPTTVTYWLSWTDRRTKKWYEVESETFAALVVLLKKFKKEVFVPLPLP